MVILVSKAEQKNRGAHTERGDVAVMMKWQIAENENGKWQQLAHNRKAFLSVFLPNLMAIFML